MAAVRTVLPDPTIPDNQKQEELPSSQELYSEVLLSHSLVDPYRFFRSLFRVAL